MWSLKGSLQSKIYHTLRGKGGQNTKNITLSSTLKPSLFYSFSHFRLITFLEEEEAQGTSICLDSTVEKDEDAKLVNEDEEMVQTEETTCRKDILKFVGASFSWQRGDSNVLHSLDLFIPSGALTVIIGKIEFER